MPDRIRFTLVENDEDVRSFDFDTETIQIGGDPTRGDNLTLNLPKGLTHVRARVIRSNDYVEFEVLGGPIWLQGSRLDEGDVAELSIGDMLTFGTKNDRGPRLRYEHAKAAEIVLDDVADWSVSAGKKKKRASAEDDMKFEEEVDEYAGLNIWQKYLKWFRKQYAKFAAWRKKAARIKYWVNVVGLIVGKVKGFVGIGLALGGGFLAAYTQYTAKLKAMMESKKAEESALIATAAEGDARAETREIKEAMVQCGCEGAVPESAAAIATADAVLDRFTSDPNLAVERPYNWPNQQAVTYASLLAGPYNGFSKDKTMLPKTLDRICSARGDKERMNLAVKEALTWNLHEAYLFVPFVESNWCELAVSHTGPRGMMQFTRSTAKLAFSKVDSSQADIPNYDWGAHREWMISYAKAKGYRSYYELLATCSAIDRAEYKKYFYPGEDSPKYPNRLDPRDARTDWEVSTKAAMAWLAQLHGVYAGRGFGEFDSIMLAMSAYNQGEGEVNTWIAKAKAHYKRDSEGAMAFPEILGGAILRLDDVSGDVEKVRQVDEGMAYAPKIIGAYLAAAPMLDARSCRD